MLAPLLMPPKALRPELLGADRAVVELDDGRLIEGEDVGLAEVFEGLEKFCVELGRLAAEVPPPPHELLEPLPVEGRAVVGVGRVAPELQPRAEELARELGAPDFCKRA